MKRRGSVPVALFVVAGIVAYAIARSRKGATTLVGMAWPVIGSITSPFGIRIHPVTGAVSGHNGIDIRSATGTPVLAPFDGVVEAVYSNDVGGKQMVVKHTNGFKTGYAHLSAQLLPEGVQVRRGDVIARVGATGQVTGPHLHFTMKNAAGQYVDPAPRLS